MRPASRELRQARLMDEMTAAGLDADPSHMFQPLDQAQHGGGLGGLRHLLQPGQPALAGVLAALRQRVEALALIGGQAIGQPAMSGERLRSTRLPARPVAQLGAKPLECRGRWDDDPTLAAGFHHQHGQIGEAVIPDRLRQQPVDQLGGRTDAERPKPKLLLALDRLTLAAPLGGEIVVDRVRQNLDLLGDEGQQRRRRPLAGAQRAAGKTQVA